MDGSLISGNRMINETIVVLGPLEDCTGHELARYLREYLVVNSNAEMNYVLPLQKLFSRVVYYDYLKRTLEAGVKGINDEVIELVKKEHPRYVVWLAAMYEFTESTLDAIREEGSILIGWFGDDEYRFAMYTKWWIPHLDYCLTFDLEAPPKYEALGGRAIGIFSCEGAPMERDWTNIEDKYEVTFVGRKSKPMRGEYVRALRENSIPVFAFGREWESGYVSYDDMIDIYRTSKINLNFSRTGNNRMGLKGRTALICLSGGFVLTEYAPGIENYFEPDKEIVCFRDTEELITKTRYYLGNDEERLAIARAGWTRAINEYTPFHMHSRIFEQLEKETASGLKRADTKPVNMPLWIRSNPSQYYFRWGRAFLEGESDNLSKDALSMSVSYDPLNVSARYYLAIRHLPAAFRKTFFTLYRPFMTFGKMYNSIRIKLFQFADSVPYLNIIKSCIAKKLHYR